MDKKLKHYTFRAIDEDVVIGIIATNHYVAREDFIQNCIKENGFEPREIELVCFEDME